MRAPLVVFFLVLAGLSGCLRADEDEGGDATQPTVPFVPDDWALQALPVRGGHDHKDPEHHLNLSTPNFEVVGWDPLITDYHGRSSGEYLCGGVGDMNDRAIAVTISFSTDVAVVLADVTDRAAPTTLGEFVLKRTHVYDADITTDNAFVALAVSTEPRDQPDAGVPLAPPMEIEWRNHCTGTSRILQEEEVPFEGGVILLDVSDPENPTFADYVPQPGAGVHSVFATVIDGTRYILASTTNLAHQASYFTIFTVTTTPLGPKLSEYGTYQAQYAGTGDSGSALINGHVDGWIQKHPKTGDLLAYLANWDGGLIIVRMDGPGRLTAIGVWNDHEADPQQTTQLDLAKATGQIHEALPIDELWDGKHYTFVGQELLDAPPGRPTGHVIMLDTTDPSRPTPAARWTLPVNVDWDEELVFSTHYVEVQDRTLFVTLYHGGVWAVGTTPLVEKELPTLGVFLPANVSPKPPEIADPRLPPWTPLVLDAHALASGELVIFDGSSGVYVVRFDPSVEVPVPEPWTSDDDIE